MTGLGRTNNRSTIPLTMACDLSRKPPTPVARIEGRAYGLIPLVHEMMADTPQSDASHDSDAGTNGIAQGKNPATAKDKECPYCHQRFTSSSLGRHLDQYIFKKRPDGIHNIEEIRRQRGGITRRTPRQGLSAKHDRAGSQPTRTSSLEARSPPAANIDLLNGKVEGGVGTRLNTFTWHSTGVINDLDTHKLAGQTPRALTPTSNKRSWGTYETGQRDAPDSRVEGDKDTVRALELALREVLDSLQAARYTGYFH